MEEVAATIWFATAMAAAFPIPEATMDEPGYPATPGIEGAVPGSALAAPAAPGNDADAPGSEGAPPVREDDEAPMSGSAGNADAVRDA